jgi:ribose 1,5-bisphosphate isomerase
MLSLLNSNIPRIIEHGGPLIDDGSTIYTHCHSSSVTSLIIAESKNKDVRVICSETRPRWQGRKTARELAENGVDTTLFVDSAIHMYQPEADLVLIGADAVGGGQLYNKIGSFMVADYARRSGIPSYSVCETQKFDPLVDIGYVQPVEQRPPEEVIEGDVPFGIKNPAFETVPIEFLTGIITEIGVLKPDEVDAVVHRYDELVPELKKLVNWDAWED